MKLTNLDRRLGRTACLADGGAVIVTRTATPYVSVPLGICGGRDQGVRWSLLMRWPPVDAGPRNRTWTTYVYAGSAAREPGCRLL